MRFFADVDFSSGALPLRVALKTEIVIALDEHFRIYRSMRLVTCGASIAQRFVHEHMGLGLLAMALRASLIQSRHRQPACRLHDVEAVRVVALRAIHAPFRDGMVLGKIEFRVRLEMAIEAGRRITARIHNMPVTHGDVLTARAVARFAPRLPRAFNWPKMQSRMRAPRKSADVIRVAIV